MASPYHHLRRLPIFFVLDDSAAVAGVFEVALHENMQTLQQELAREAITLRSVYLSVILFGQQVQPFDLTPVDRFMLPPLTAQGPRPLHTALHHVRNALEYELIIESATTPGDARPLIFIVLGDAPERDWEAPLQAITQYADNRRPTIIALGLDAAAVAPLAVTQVTRLALRERDGTCLARFFDWTTEVITQRSEAYARGDRTSTLPPLPRHIQQV